MKAALVLGTRPQIIKSTPLIHLANKDKEIQLDIIHTGQHYDYKMTQIFFKELNLPDPIVNLDAGGGDHVQQTAKVMVRLGKMLERQKPQLVIVPGDTNSTLAGALTAAKLCIPVAHIEAGARCYDIRMPEEINRRVTDHCSTLLFTPTENCTRNLLREGISEKKIYQTGDTMYDVLLQQLPKIEKTNILNDLDLKTKNYILVTVHRQENVDNLENLKNIAEAIAQLGTFITIVFPVHPRTQKQLKKHRLDIKLKKQNQIRLVEPLGYCETLKLIKNAALILTDSGGIQKESFWLKTPCLTLRQNTEWPETIRFGVNYLVGTNTDKIIRLVRKILENKEQIDGKLQKIPNPFGDGKASQRILEIIKFYLTQ